MMLSVSDPMKEDAMKKLLTRAAKTALGIGACAILALAYELNQYIENKRDSRKDHVANPNIGDG